MKQSTAYTRTFLMVLTSDHISPATGKTVTVNLSKAGGTFAAAGGTITEVANGWYKIALTTTDTNTLGDLTFNCTATSCDNTDFADQIVAFDTGDAVRLGLSSLPNASAQSAGGLPTVGTGASQIDVDSSGRVNLGKWLGTAPNTLNVGRVDAGYSIRSGTAQAGASPTITLDAGASATDNYYTNEMIVTTGGTGGPGQVRPIIGYVGSTKVASIYPNWATNPDSTTTFMILPFAEVNMWGIQGSTWNGAVNVTNWNGATVNNLVSGRVDCSVGNIAAGQLFVKKNTAFTFTFAMFDSTNHQLVTGKTVTVKFSIDGGALATTTNSVVEISGGLYKIALLAAETNGTVIALTITATGADDQAITFVTQA